MPHHFTVGFTIAAHHVVQHDNPFLISTSRPSSGPTLKAYWHPHTAYNQHYLWPILWNALSLSWPTYELLTLWVSSVHRSTHFMIHSTPWGRIILRIRSYFTSRVTPYGSSQLISWASYRMGYSMGTVNSYLVSWLPKSNHVTFHVSYKALRAHYGLQCSIIAIRV